MLSITCPPSYGEQIGVRMEPDTRNSAIGILNSHQLLPGVVLDLMDPPPGYTVGIARVVYVLRLRHDDYQQPQRLGWFTHVVNKPFALAMDDDLVRELGSTGIQLQERISSAISLETVGAKLEALRDPVTLINRDGHAADAILSRGNAGKLVIVSGVTYGNGLQLAYDAPDIAANTVHVAHFYLHLKYMCSAVEALNKKSTLSKSPIPVLFNYVPIAFDSVAAKFVALTDPVDLTKFEVTEGETE